MKFKQLFWCAVVMLLGSLLMMSCADSELNSQMSGNGVASGTEAEPSLEPTPTVDLNSVPQTNIIIDGLDDDWQNARGRKSDPAEDQTSGTPDFASGAAQNNLTHFYVSASFHSRAPIMYYIIFVDVTGRGWDYQIMLDPITGRSTISPFGPVLEFKDAPDIAMVLGETLEVRIPITYFDNRPVTNLTLATSTGSTWFGDQVEDIQPETKQEADLLVFDSANAGTILEERPGHVWLVDQQDYAGYLSRAFLQAPNKLTWGPDGMMYVGDVSGRHVVRIAKDGTQEDLGLWRTVGEIQQNGANGVSFDQQGEMYVFSKNQILRVGPDQEIELLDGISGSPLGDVIFDADNTLYYTDVGGGTLKRWTPEDGSTIVASGLNLPENMAFGLDGTLYITLQNQDRVVKVDIETGAVSEFISGYVGGDPNYITVDADGDIWVRALRGLLQFTPDGTLKPFYVDGEEYSGGANSDNWTTSAGIAFDDEGALWVASYNSLVLRLVPDASQGVDAFTRTVISTGLQPFALAISPDGTVYASDNNTHSILQFVPGEAPVTILQDNLINNAPLAVNQDSQLFIGLADRRIVRLEPDGSYTFFADFLPLTMLFGLDGALYAVDFEEGQDARILKITAPGEAEVWLTEIAGDPLGIGELSLALDTDQGLYVFKQRGRDLYRVSYDGQGEWIANLLSLGVVGEFGGPVAFGASPFSGMMYYIPHGPYRFYEIDPQGNEREIGSGLVGDPSSMVVSPDGHWLYVNESGAINIIPIQVGE